MPRLNITERSVSQLKVPEKGQGTVFYHDERMSGFQVGKGRRTCTFYAFVARRGRGMRMRIGYWPQMTVAEARNRAASAIAEFRLGNDPRRTSNEYTLQELFDEATAERLADGRISEKTANYYRYVFNLYASRIANKPIAEITDDDARAMKRRIAPYSFNLTKRIIDASFQTMNKPSPFAGVRSNKEEARDSNIDDYAAWYEFVRKIDNPNTRRCLLLLALTGMRKNNACSLRWQDIDFDTAVITLEKTKTGRNVKLRMGEAVRKLLTAQRDMQVNSPWVFPSYISKGKHITDLRLGQPGRVHDLRRQFTSACVRARLYSAAIKKMRGDKLTATDEAYFTDLPPIEWSNEVAEIIISDWGTTVSELG